jgi:hypothetical protein
MKNTFASIFVARGLTVLMMPAIHIVMMYSRPDVYHSWWAYILQFFAEGPGAQLFMLLMGFFLATGKTKSTRAIFTRSFSLLAAGYTLNFFRTYLPAQLGLFPNDMLHYYVAGAGSFPNLPLLLTGDILQFAAMAYGITGLIVRQRNSSVYASVIYFFIAIGAPFVWGIRSDSLILDHLLALVCANDHRAFFPLFPWLCYPMAGLIVGVAFTRSALPRFYNGVGITGVVLMATGMMLLLVTPAVWDPDFYRSSIGKTMAYTGFILLWLYLVYKIMLHCSLDHLLVRLLSFCSQHITMIYFLHWLIVCWCLPITGYHQLNKGQTLLAIAVICTLSFGLVRLFSKMKLPSSTSNQ